jgi:predicted porin
MNLKVIGAAALFLSAATVGGMSAARAADLGGDCCADLEERVAELEATTARKGNRKVSLEIYGQVNTGVLYFNNGNVSDTYIVDNSNSPTRFGLRGSAKISPSLKAGFNIEISAISAGSSSVSITDDDGGQAGDGALAVRFANWYLDHKSLGRVSVGRISSAMDGIQEIDLVGTSVVSLPGINVGNKILVAGTVVTWDQVMHGFDGDRVNGIRYDTPTFGGFQLSTSFSENDRYDVTLRYAGEFGGFRVAAGIGYGLNSDNADTTVNFPLAPLNAVDENTLLSGSASVLHVSSGLFLTGFAGRRSIEGGIAGDFDETNWGLRAGIAKNWFGIGNTVLFGEYNRFSNINNIGANGVVGGPGSLQSEVWGVSIIQNIDAAAMELFLSYKNYSIDFAPAQDMDIIFSGARIKF